MKQVTIEELENYNFKSVTTLVSYKGKKLLSHTEILYGNMGYTVEHNSKQVYYSLSIHEAIEVYNSIS